MLIIKVIRIVAYIILHW